jgi:hypothetical protein
MSCAYEQLHMHCDRQKCENTSTGVLGRNLRGARRGACSRQQLDILWQLAAAMLCETEHHISLSCDLGSDV